MGEDLICKHKVTLENKGGLQPPEPPWFLRLCITLLNYTSNTLPSPCSYNVHKAILAGHILGHPFEILYNFISLPVTLSFHGCTLLLKIACYFKA